MQIENPGLERERERERERKNTESNTSIEREKNTEVFFGGGYNLFHLCPHIQE
jgi:hypothetical protein